MGTKVEIDIDSKALKGNAPSLLLLLLTWLGSQNLLDTSDKRSHEVLVRDFFLAQNDK